MATTPGAGGDSGAPATAGEGRSQRSVAFCTPPLRGVRCSPLVLIGLPSCCCCAAAAAAALLGGNSSEVTACRWGGKHASKTSAQQLWGVLDTKRQAQRLQTATQKAAGARPRLN